MTTRDGRRSDGLLDTAAMRLVAGVLAVVWPGLLLIYLSYQTRAGLTNGQGIPFGDDFINYWTSARFALTGRIADLYQQETYHAFQEAVLGGWIGFYHYSYPPVAPLLLAPFGLLPYVPAFAVWIVLGVVLLGLALRSRIPDGTAWLLAVATPGTLINGLAGQNATYTAAALGGGLAVIERRPVLAGALIGFLVAKPQLALLVPFALVAGRRWSTLAAAAAMAAVLAVTATAIFGWAIWPAYAERATMLRHFVLEDGEWTWHRMPSVFVAARILGAAVPLAYAAQAAAAAVAGAATVMVWRRRDGDMEAKAAVLVLAGFLATPYLLDYDLTVGVFPALWLWRRDTPMARSAAVSLLVLPLAHPYVLSLTWIPIGPPVLALALGAAWRAAPRGLRGPSATARAASLSDAAGSIPRRRPCQAA